MADNGETKLLSPEPSLRRTLSLPLITLYGIGTTVGAGIYVLVGEVAQLAGPGAPLSFVLAALLAGLSALSFAELCGRFPRSAGEAVYVYEAFGRRWLSVAVGLMVMAAGTVSAATVIRGSVGYLNEFIDLPALPIVVSLAAILGVVAIWGISQAAITAAVLTLVELGGLALVIGVGAPALERLPVMLSEVVPADGSAIVGMTAGALVAFFAFIGFEDMVNVAEEVRDAPRVMPLAIVITLVVTTVLYFLVTIITVIALPAEVLSGSTAPLARVLEQGFGGASELISGISIVAVVNGALVQIIMASRILYGLSRSGDLPRFLGYVSPHTRTPVFATIIVTALIATVAAAAPLATLATIASIVILLVFAVVNAALLVIKARRGTTPTGSFRVPRVVPALGLLASLAIVLFELGRRLVL